ncbi:MAG TPA: recombinase family protein, partial [bacterium]|nr:recombinase family protein [bacterium]
KRDIRGKMDKGEYPSMAPLGYINLDSEGRIAGKAFDSAKQKYFMELADQRPLQRVEIDPVVGPMVKQLFNWVAYSNLSLEETRQRAIDEGLRGQRSQAKVAKSTIQGILTNPFYYGLMQFAGETAVGNHEPIVDKDLFDAVQEVLKQHSRPRKKNSHKKFLRGLIECGECGCAITTERQKGWLYYRCTKKKAKCHQAYIRSEILEARLSEAINEVILPQDFIDWAKRNLVDVHLQESQELEIRRKGLQMELNTTKNQLANLLTLKISAGNADGSLLSDQEYREQKNKLQDAELKIQNKIGDLNQQERNWLKDCELYFEFNNRLQEKFIEGSVEQQRIILNLIGSNIILRDGNVAIIHKEPYSYAYELNRTLSKRLEPQKKPVSTGETGFFYDDCTVWRSRPDSNR